MLLDDATSEIHVCLLWRTARSLRRECILAKPALKGPWCSLLAAVTTQYLLPLQLKQVCTGQHAGYDHGMLVKRSKKKHMKMLSA